MIVGYMKPYVVRTCECDHPPGTHSPSHRLSEQRVLAAEQPMIAGTRGSSVPVGTCPFGFGSHGIVHPRSERIFRLSGEVGRPDMFGTHG